VAAPTLRKNSTIQRKDGVRSLKVFSKVLDFVQAVFKWIIIVAMFTFTVVIIVSVFCRYVLENSLTWSEQVSRFLFVWVIMLGIPILYRTKLATNLDLVVEHFPPKLQAVTAIAMDIIVGILAVYYGYGGLRYTLKAGANIFQGLNIPTAYIYISEVACGAMLLLCTIESVIYRVIDLVRGGAGKEAGEA
jgi:TRAP-type C4-dicarboxylate transport system permease small subunit